DGYLRNVSVCTPGILASILSATGLINATGLCSSSVTGFQNSPIFIHFTEDMDLSTTDAAFTISPAINGIKTWSQSGNALCGSTGPCTSTASLLTFTPTQPWQPSLTYSVTILGSATDISGNDLGTNSSFSFTVGTDYQIPQVIRPDGFLGPGCNPGPGTLASVVDPIFGLRDKTGFCSSIVPGNLNSPVVIDFTEDMDIASVNSSISISPGIIGVKSWSMSPLPQCGSTGPCGGAVSQLTFTPSQPWSIATYNVNISNGAKDLDGNSMSGYSFSFTVGTDFDPPDMDYTVGGPLFSDKATAPCAAAALTSIVSLDTDVCNTAAGMKLRIRFDEAMDQSATMNSFSISPGVTGAFTWPTPQELLFTPSQDLQLFKQYKVTITTGAKDLAGNPLTSDFTRYFSTGDGSGLVDLTPPNIANVFSDTTGGAGGCDGAMNDSLFASFIGNVCTDNGGSGQGANFEIQFSENMNQSVTSQAFSISPSVSGTISWAAGNIMRFSTSQSLNPNVQYQITFNQNAADVAGNKLQSPYILFFQTSPVGGNPGVTTVVVSAGTVAACGGGGGVATDILSATVNNGCQGNPGTNPIVVNFTEPMNQPKTQSGFSISPGVNGSFTWPTATQMVFTPDNSLSYGTRYNITLSTSVEDVQGQRLGNQVFGTFVVGAPDVTPPNISCPGCGIDFEINGDGDSCGAVVPNDVVNQQNGSSGTLNVCSGGNALRIVFSENMNQVATTNAISFSPSVNVTFSWVGNVLTIVPLTTFASDKFYSITVSTSAKDLAGNSLPGDFQVGFKTENSSPKVYAVGLGSQVGCTNFTGVPSVGSIIGGTWASANCFWDNTLSILQPGSYHFLAGNLACVADSQTDNIRIIFDKPMDIVSTASAVSLRRISPPLGSVIKSSWSWSDTNHVLTMSFSEGALCMDLVRNLLNDPSPNYPFYIIDVDQTAKDANGNSLAAPFSFIMEGD
ncbi:MAG: Ig-like domain-containing protein, partial [Leptospira sp.]|nr:Ig-like domain-containing protein [Leptospira sp.]